MIAPGARGEARAKPDAGFSLRDAALALAAARLPTFPCNANKVPCISKRDGGNGFHDATTDPATIRRMCGHRGTKLIGVPTGPASGLNILDVDPRHRGDAWECAHADRLPETRMHRTQSGGRHYVFRHALGLGSSQGRIARGVDVRAEGGYAIWPPSPGYSIISDVEPVDWPVWLLDLARRPEPTPSPPPSSAPTEPISSKRLEAYVESVLAGVRCAVDGMKHIRLRDAALAIGGVAAEAGLSDETAIARLLDALPRTVRDWTLARRTAVWALEQGRAKPITLEDWPNPRAQGERRHTATVAG